MNTTAEAVAVRANEWWVTNTRGQQINFFSYCYPVCERPDHRHKNDPRIGGTLSERGDLTTV